MNENKLKINRLLLHYDYIDSYLQEVKYKHSVYNTIFLNEYYELNPQDKNIKEPEPCVTNKENTIDSDNTNDTIDSDNTNELKDSLNPEIKDFISKLYRKISLKTHPDKQNNDNEIFIKVLEAYKTNNILELLKMSNKFNIEYTLNDTIFTYIEDEITKIEQKINELKHNVCWLWCNADENTKKNFKLPV